jgi:hypothetical protein
MVRHPDSVRRTQQVITVALSNVNFIPQQVGLCGAACAQMILAAQGRVSASMTDQTMLWGRIKANTIGNGRGHSVTLCPHFNTQICEHCKPSGEFCWCTHPDALAQTIAGYQVPVVRRSLGSEPTLTAQVVNAISVGVQTGTGLAPIVLVHEATHWVVVYGFVHDETGQSGRRIGGFNVTELLVHDPELDASNDHCTIDVWFALYLRDIDCGAFAGQQVMVGA